MPERAEIEAVARALLHKGIGSWDEQSELRRSYLLKQAEKAIEALDRVRGARGDDESLAAEIVKRLRYSDGIAPDEAVREVADWIESQFLAARSPQGEDHEAALTEAFTLLRAVHEEGADMTWELHGKIRAFLDGQNTDGG